MIVKMNGQKRLTKIVLLFLFMLGAPNNARGSPETYDLRVEVIDQSERPIAGAIVMISGTPPFWAKGNTTLSMMTTSNGWVSVNYLPEGIKDIIVTWKSQYNPEAITIARTSIMLDKTTVITLRASVYEAELKIVTPSGIPISGAYVSLAGAALGMTGADGEVVAPQVPSKYTEADATAYPVTVIWLGVDVSPSPVAITASWIYTLTATNVATLTVQVVGAGGQGLDMAQVNIRDSTGTAVFSGATNEQGIVSVEVPYGIYSIHTDYKGFTSDSSTTVNSAAPSPVKMSNSVFIELFGQAMTFATFVLWLVILSLLVGIPIIIVVKLKRKMVPPVPPLPESPKPIEEQQKLSLQPLPRPVEKPAIPCPTCGSPLIWYADAERYYCRKCVRWYSV